jgi:nucleoside 2-deoxyribosyltransferase
MSEHTIYLAGPVAALDDGGASWREELVNEYAEDDVHFENPVAKYNVPAGDVDIVPAESDDPSEVTPGEIVEADKEMLRESDGVLVGYSNVQSIGTPMEVMWAFEHVTPVVVWIRDDTLYSELSPWYRYHADAVTTSRSGAVEKLRLAVDELASAEDVFAGD